MREIMGSLGSVSPTIMGLDAATDVATSVVPHQAVPGALKKPSGIPSMSESVTRFAPHVGTFAAGYLGRKFMPFGLRSHPILSGLAGHAVGYAAWTSIKGKDTKRALCELAVEAAGIYGALKHSKIPVVKGIRGNAGMVAGWLAGAVAASAVTYFAVPGSPARDEWSWLKSKL
jgi:hypothetical protein